MMEKLEHGIKCRPWHVEATPAKHFGECFDITFEYLPNFNISIYRVKSISRMPFLWDVGNAVGWVTQYIVMSNGRELFRLNGCAHLEPDFDKVSVLCMAIAIIDRVSRILSNPNRRFQVATNMSLKPSDLYYVVLGFKSSDILEHPAIVPTSNFDYVLAMLYQLYIYETGGVAQMVVAPSYSFADMMTAAVTQMRKNLFPPTHSDNLARIMRRLDIIPDTTDVAMKAKSGHNANTRNDRKEALAQFHSHSDVEYFGKQILGAIGFTLKDLDLGIYGGIHNLRSMLYRMQETGEDVTEMDANRNAIPFYTLPGDDWTVIENEN
jgi:hypothetical protein